VKVLYFHQHFSTRAGATGTRSYEFARQLIASGHKVTMVCGSSDLAHTGLTGTYKNGKRRGLVDGIDVIELHLPYSNKNGFLKRTSIFLSFAVRGIWTALREPHDLVYASSTPLTVAIPALVSRWVRGKPFVFEVRDLWPELPRAMGVISNPLILWAMELLERSTYRSAQRVIGLAPGIVTGIVEKGAAPANVALIPNGCDMSLFADQPAQSDPELPQGFKLIYCGAHGLANGLQALLVAARELQTRGVQACLLLIGDGREKAGLLKSAEQLGLENCLFLDAMPKTELAVLLQRCDIGIMCLLNIPAFYFGTSPNKFFDYIAAGLPVINNYPGDVADMITEHGCGTAVAPDDPLAFADAVESLMADPARLAASRRASRRLAEQFSRKRLGGQFVRLLEAAYADHLYMKN
jgi:glycosyltransferase involved in cell wall biosynthesis